MALMPAQRSAARVISTLGVDVVKVELPTATPRVPSTPSVVCVVRSPAMIASQLGHPAWVFIRVTSLRCPFPLSRWNAENVLEADSHPGDTSSHPHLACRRRGTHESFWVASFLYQGP